MRDNYGMVKMQGETELTTCVDAALLRGLERISAQTGLGVEYVLAMAARVYASQMTHVLDALDERERGLTTSLFAGARVEIGAPAVEQGVQIEFDDVALVLNAEDDDDGWIELVPDADQPTAPAAD